MRRNHSNGTYFIRTASAIGAIVGLLATTACGTGNPAAGSDSSEATLSDGDVTIRVTWWGGGERAKITEKVIAAFEKEHPNIHVSPEYSDFGGYMDKLSTQIAGGEAPDVIQMNKSAFSTYASQGTFYDLSRTPQLSFADVDSAVVDTGKYEGVQYAAPMSTNYFSMVVNMDILDQLGIALPDTSTWTWDDLDALQKEIFDKSGGTVYGTTLLANKDLLDIWVRQHGEELFTNGKLSVKPETVEGFFQRTLDDVNAGILGAPDRWAETANANLEMSDFGTKKAAFRYGFSNQLSSYAKVLGTENIKLILPPSDSKGQWGWTAPSQYWTVSSKSEHPAEAALFIDYFINNADAGDILGTERGYPANNQVRKSLASKSTGIKKAEFDFIDEASAVAGKSPESSPAGVEDFTVLIARYQENVIFGKMSPKDAANEMLQVIQTGIDTGA